MVEFHCVLPYLTNDGPAGPPRAVVASAAVPSLSVAGFVVSYAVVRFVVARYVMVLSGNGIAIAVISVAVIVAVVVIIVGIPGVAIEAFSPICMRANRNFTGVSAQASRCRTS